MKKSEMYALLQKLVLHAAVEDEEKLQIIRELQTQESNERYWEKQREKKTEAGVDND